MRTEIRGGAVLDAASPAEVKQAIDQGNADFFRERARGIATWRFESEPETVAGGSVKLPGAAGLKCGPNPGFAILVTTLRAQGLASGDVLSVYRNSISSVPVAQFVMGAAGTVDVITTGSKSLILLSDERLIFHGTGLTAVGDITVTADGIECPAPDIWKLIG